MESNLILIIAAVVPAIFLMRKVYLLDRLEQEPPHIIRKLIIAGILATFIALLTETIGEAVLSDYLAEDTVLYQVILYFGIVAISEEVAKYYMMKRVTWRSPEFNCQYDGVLYAVVVSLGFALWENIGYVLSYGFSTAVLRAVTAIPGHASFGVFMGIYYGLAKKHHNLGHGIRSRWFRRLAVWIPILIHGAYDYIASMENDEAGFYFIVFVVLMFILAFRFINHAAENDQYICKESEE